MPAEDADVLVVAAELVAVLVDAPLLDAVPLGAPVLVGVCRDEVAVGSGVLVGDEPVDDEPPGDPAVGDAVPVAVLVEELEPVPEDPDVLLDDPGPDGVEVPVDVEPAVGVLDTVEVGCEGPRVVDDGDAVDDDVFPLRVSGERCADAVGSAVGRNGAGSRVASSREVPPVERTKGAEC